MSASINPASSPFESTDWSVIQKLDGPHAEQALATLCEHYWHPLYAYVRRRVNNVHMAQDLTQGFFTHLLEKDSLRHAAQDRGRFRAFILTALKNFMATEYARERTVKRGGGRRTISLDFADGEQHFNRIAVDRMSPDRVFDRSWTLSVLERVVQRLRSEFIEADELPRFDALLPALTSPERTSTYAEIAANLKLSPEAARKAASRLRKRYRELLQAEVGRTLVDPSDVEDEIRHMFASLKPT